MELTLNLVLMIIAVICLALAALKIETGRISIGWLGLFFWALAALL